MKLAGIVVALAVFIGGAYLLLLHQGSDEVIAVAPASLPAPVPEPGLRLQEGHASTKDAKPIAVGDLLNEEVRTDGEGYALFGGDGASIRLGPDTQLMLRHKSESGYDFYLAGGTVEATSDGPRLQFFGAGTSGFVRIENGAARLLADGTHGLVVGSERGNVWVENAGKQVLVPNGQATRLLAEKAPDNLWKLPAAMLLKVSWPKDSEIAIRRLQVTGTASPGTLIRAHGQKTLVDGQGRFKVDLPLNEGINTLQLSAEDAGGRSQHSKFKVKVDTTPAEVGVDTSPDMWKRRK